MDSTRTLDTVNTTCVCKTLQDLKITPKEVIIEFFISKDEELASRRRFWATPTGWDSTMSLLKTIQQRFMATADGKKKWESFIEEELRLIPQAC